MKMPDQNTTEHTPRIDNLFTAAHVARMQETIERLTRERDEAHAEVADYKQTTNSQRVDYWEAREKLQSDLAKARESLRFAGELRESTLHELNEAREEIARLTLQFNEANESIFVLRAELAAANARADHFRARVEAAHIAAGYDPKQDCDIAEVIACLLTRAKEGETRAEKAERERDDLRQKLKDTEDARLLALGRLARDTAIANHDRDEALALVEKLREALEKLREENACGCSAGAFIYGCNRCRLEREIFKPALGGL